MSDQCSRAFLNNLNASLRELINKEMLDQIKLLKELLDEEEKKLEEIKFLDGHMQCFSRTSKDGIINYCIELYNIFFHKEIKYLEKIIKLHINQAQIMMTPDIKLYDYIQYLETKIKIHNDWIQTLKKEIVNFTEEETLFKKVEQLMKTTPYELECLVHERKKTTDLENWIEHLNNKIWELGE